MYISEVPIEPSALQKAYQEEVTLVSVFGSLATGSCRIGLIILGNVLAGLVCYVVWKLSKRTYRAFTGHDPQAKGGFIALSGFMLVGVMQWAVLQAVGCGVQHFGHANSWQDSTRRLIERTFDGVFPLMVSYVVVTRMYNWSVIKKNLTMDERRGIIHQFMIGSVLLVVADLEYFFAERSEQYANSQLSQYVAHGFVVVLLALATRSFTGWFRGIKRTYDAHHSQFLGFTESDEHHHKHRLRIDTSPVASSRW